MKLLIGNKRKFHEKIRRFKINNKLIDNELRMEY